MLCLCYDTEKYMESGERKLLDLFWTFFKIGLFTFGGGYAMIAVVEDICVEVKKWITREEMLELIVIAEATPGPIAINCATYVGYRERGLKGAVAATVGMVLPSLIIICVLAAFLDRFLEISVITHAFRGIQVGVGVIILNAGIKMLKDIPKTHLARGILLVACIVMLAVDFLGLNLSTITLLVSAGIIGFVAYKVKGGAKA